MKKVFAGMAVVAALGWLFTTQGATQPDPNEKPTFGTVELKAGFKEDPHTKEVIAGGPHKTDHGKVDAWVAKAPDYRLKYTAGDFALTIYVKSEDDVTLLVNLPDGKWVANADGKLKFKEPKSGQYDIWVGTPKKGKAPKAKIYITELK
jgi:hypothetical protein